MLLQTVIKASSINDAWFKALKACMEVGTDYKIDKGEFEGQFRRELDLVTLHIDQPWIRPLACQSQQITPTTDAKIEAYFNEYILEPGFWGKDALKEFENNEYKYSTWIGPNWQDKCNLLLKGAGGCNQATILIGSMVKPDQNGNFYQIHKAVNVENGEVVSSGVEFVGEIVKFKKPPCLCTIDMRLRDNKLHFIVYFRSWDLVAGFPENLGGLQRLKEHCVAYMNSEARAHPPLYTDGSIIAVSKGLHIYDHFWKQVEEYVGKESVVKYETSNSGIWSV